jgi:hypothetical protein
MDPVGQSRSPYQCFIAVNDILGTIPCTGNVGELCGGSTCIVIFGYRGMGSTSTFSTSPITATTSYPASSGTPNCLDRSPFSGTVNGDYLILCDTALPGYDIAQANGASLADCISACNSYVASSSPQQEPCVAVEYDQVSLWPACRRQSYTNM